MNDRAAFKKRMFEAGRDDFLPNNFVHNHGIVFKSKIAVVVARRWTWRIVDVDVRKIFKEEFGYFLLPFLVVNSFARPSQFFLSNLRQNRPIFF